MAKKLQLFFNQNLLKHLLALIIGLFLFEPVVQAATKTFTGTGNFSNAALWGGTLPLAGDVLRIDGTCTFDNAANNLAYGTLQVGNAVNAVLQWPVGGTNTLNVLSIIATASGHTGSIDMTNGGTLQIGTSNWVTTRQTFTPGAGTIVWVDSAAISTLPATITTYNNLTITVTGYTANLGVATTINGNLLLSAGTFSTGNFALNIKGDFTNNGTFTQGTSTTLFNGATQTIGGSNPTTFNNLTISSSASTTLAINTSVAGNLNVTTGDAFDLSTFTCNRTGAGGTLTVAGTLLLGGTSGGQTGSNFPTNFNTLTMTGGTVDYDNSTGGQTIYSTPTYATLTLGNTSGIQTAGGNITATVLNNNTNAADILNMGTNTLTVTTPNNTGTIRTQNTSGLPISSGKTWSGSIIFDGATTQTIPASNFNNLTLNTAALGGAVNVAGNLTLTSGIVTSTATNLLAITNTSPLAITGYSASSYINGPLQWSLASGNSYLFPVGDASNYRPFELNSITCSTPVVRVTMSGTGATTADGTTLSSVAPRNWYAELISGGFTSATVRITENILVSTNAVASSSAQSGNYTSQGGNSIGATITSNAAIPYTTSTYFAIGTKAPSLVLSDNGTQITSASVSGGSSNVVLHQSALAVTLVNATLTGMTCITSGTYVSGDITNLKVWYQTGSTFNPGTATLLSTLTTPGTAGTKTFSSFISQALNSGTTGYIYITADVAPGATVGNTISLNALTTGNFTFTSASKTGSTTAGGIQTFIGATFYNKSSGAGALQTLSNWGTNTDGTGTAPLSFTANNQLFNIYNGTTATIGGAWTVSGSGSKVILGNSANTAITFTVPSGNAFTGPIDIAAASSGSNTLILQNGTVPTLGTLNAGSTVVFGYQGASQTVPAATYGNLTISGLTGTTTFTLGGTATIAGNLSVTSGTFDLGINTANRSVAGGTFTVSGNLLCGGTSGGQNGSNFPINFSTLALPAVKLVMIMRLADRQFILSLPIPL